MRASYAYQSSACIHKALVFGKCRNAPIKTPTIPRLELVARVMAVRISNLSVWYSGLTPRLCFIATRLEEAHEHTAPDKWHHVPGIVNPADNGGNISFTRHSCRIIVPKHHLLLI